MFRYCVLSNFQLRLSDFLNPSFFCLSLIELPVFQSVTMVVKDEKSEKSLELFLKIGLDERTARNTVANNKVTANLTAVIHEVCLSDLIFSF